MTAVLFTCAGQRVDIVTAFGRAGARTVAADANPLAPALYHADVHALVPRVDDPAYIAGARASSSNVHDVRLVVPLTDLDQQLLLASGATSSSPRSCCSRTPDVVEAMNDKYLAHVFFVRARHPVARRRGSRTSCPTSCRSPCS